MSLRSVTSVRPYLSVQFPLISGVKLDRSLTYRPHLEALRKKLCASVSLLRRLVGTGWGASAKTLCTAALSLVYSIAEYCAPVWCRSVHIRLIDSVINDALRIVTGCLRPTPSVYPPVLSGIQPAELRRQGATLSLANRSSLDPDHILHGQFHESQDVCRERLKSRHSFVPAARKLLDSLSETCSPVDEHEMGHGVLCQRIVTPRFHSQG